MVGKHWFDKVHRWRLYFLVGAFAVAGLVAFLLFSSMMETPPAETQPLPPALVIPQLKGEGIFHVKVKAEERTSSGAVAATEWREYWIDVAGLKARVEKASPEGSVAEIQVRLGNSLYTYIPSQDYVSHEQAPGPNTFWLNTIENELWHDYRALSLGAQKLGEEIVDGKQVVKVRKDITDEGMVTGQAVAYLDKTNYLPVKKAYYELGSAGELIFNGETVYAYEPVEWLPVGEVPVALFAPRTRPSTATGQGTWPLTLAEAGTFEDFGLYYLGDSFKGLPLQVIQEYKYRAPVPDWPDDHSVEVVYGVPAVNPLDNSEDLRIQQVNASAETPGMPSPWDLGTVVRARGVEGRLLEQDNRVSLKLTLGDTLIIITGKDRSQVLGAAATLTKLN